MSALDVTMNIITLGGHSRLKVAKNQYEIAYSEYKQIHTKAISLQASIQSEVELLGGITKKSFTIISKSYQILRSGRLGGISESQQKLTSVTYGNETPKTKKILSRYLSTFSVTKGVGAATTATVGSWALVSLLGTASTGASIAGLTGVAATNATLAWFGGGALTAGGAGMAGGTMVLGGLLVAPLVIFSAWSSYSKADDIDSEKVALEQTASGIKLKVLKLESVLSLITNQRVRLEEEYDRVYLEYCKVKQSLFPYGALSTIARRFRRLFGFTYYSSNETVFLKNLAETLETFSANFNAAPLQ